MRGTNPLTDEDRRYLLNLARETVERTARGLNPPEPNATGLSPALLEPADVFVTLYRFGELRGCIGSRGTERPLYQAVIESATASCSRDPRFPPVIPSELDGLEVSVSVLSPAVPVDIQCIDDIRNKIHPHIHGVILTNGVRKALYLPQVWEHFSGASDIHEAFLSSLSRKAGDPTGSLWKQPSTRYEVFTADTFREADFDQSV